MKYLELSARLNELTRRYAAAVADGDLYQQAAIRLERAVVEMDLRDLFGGASTREGGRFHGWMCDDVEQAGLAADKLARRVGDDGLFERLLRPFDRLHVSYSPPRSLAVSA